MFTWACSVRSPEEKVEQRWALGLQLAQGSFLPSTQPLRVGVRNLSVCPGPRAEVQPACWRGFLPALEPEEPPSHVSTCSPCHSRGGFSLPSFGLAPAAPLQVHAPLSPNQTVEISLPLNTVGSVMKMEPLNNLQVCFGQG